MARSEAVANNGSPPGAHEVNLAQEAPAAARGLAIRSRSSFAC